MKIILIPLTTACMFLAGCNSSFSKSKLVDFIPGVYAASQVSAYSEIKDTILIEPVVNNDHSTYHLTRRTFINYTSIFKKEPEYKIVHWTGSFNPAAGTILVDNNGRILSLDPERNEMMMGVVAYKKL